MSAERLPKPLHRDAIRVREDDIFITRLPVGLWHKLGKQSAKRNGARKCQFLAPLWTGAVADPRSD
jgi:hypothetical protein